MGSADEMKCPNALAFFAIGAVVDFIFGCGRGHSVGFGLVAIIAGLPLTALLYFLFKAFGGGNGISRDPRG
jgi:hypothetical protein